MIRRLHLALVLVLLTLLAGCTFSTPSSSSRSGSSPRVRCLNNPNEGDTRPMIFLFCAESP